MKIKDLTVTVTFRVGLSDLDLPDKVYDGLCIIQAYGELVEAYDPDDSVL